MIVVAVCHLILINMSEFPEFKFEIKRRQTTTCTVGSVKIGSDHPIAVQSMTTSLTTDVKETLYQIDACHELGADLMRVSVPNEESAIAIKEICQKSPVPIIADLHFNTYRDAIYRKTIEGGVGCIRINPGTLTPRGVDFDSGKKNNTIKNIVEVLKDYNCAVRIGVNTGSLDEKILQKYGSPTPEALVESAMESVKYFEDNDFFNFKIAVKASDPLLMIKSYELLASKVKYPLHLGVTEAGPMMLGTVKSSIGIGNLLLQGIGDTIRISLSDKPEEEIKVCWALLKSLQIRSRGVNIISCPSCARQQFNVIDIVKKIEQNTAHIKKNMSISILGCVVNGLGEATHTDIGVTGAVSGHHIIYKHGKPFGKCSSEDLVSYVTNLAKEISGE